QGVAGKDPTQLAGTQVADGMRRTSDVANGGSVIRTGVEQYKAAISLIEAGTPINYEGASGPMDFDANQNILDRLAHYKVADGAFVDVQTFDCVTSSTCPPVGQ
ncbi:MAG TPA: hypothetical protein VFB81_17275, partial [Myxococcales bacterium]|nr:hypothetical protein [Myxococcales bacterium]